MAALDWGLGHAARCIPLVRHFLSEGKRVVLASDGRAAALLASEFPQLPLCHLPSYQIQYGKGSMVWNMARQMPRITYAALAEHRAVRQIADTHAIDMIVSDNRFGCYHPSIHSCFLTHQLRPIIQQPIARWLGQQANLFWIKKYNECWVPDFAGSPNLSGPLSHPSPIPHVRYIGPLSRMRPLKIPKRYQAAIVLSGPEPQRSYLERILLAQCENTPNKILLVQGKTETSTRTKNGNVEIVSHLKSQGLNEAICAASWVVCRPGYSTLMDLEATGSRALLIPTPGQTEQEFLAEHFKRQGRHLVQPQNAVDLRAIWANP